MPVGLANLGVRGDEGWIGGVGVIAAERRRGVGRTLMDAAHAEARARGLRRVWLEVIDANAGAFALYERLGYRVVRDVEVWSLAAEVPAGAAREVPAEQAHGRIGELRTEREPWQRADASLSHFTDLRGLEVESGAAVFRIAGATVQLVQLAGDDADQLVRTLRSYGRVAALNLPAGGPAAVAFGALGGEVTVRQHEMLVEL